MAWLDADPLRSAIERRDGNLTSRQGRIPPDAFEGEAALMRGDGEQGGEDEDEELDLEAELGLGPAPEQVLDPEAS